MNYVRQALMLIGSSPLPLCPQIPCLDEQQVELESSDLHWSLQSGERKYCFMQRDLFCDGWQEKGCTKTVGRLRRGSGNERGGHLVECAVAN